MSEVTNVPDTWLTQEAYDRLSAELEELSGPVRTEIAKRIEQAREEGDIRENAGYDAAKDEQARNEARIRQLTHLLHTAKVGEAPVTDGIAGPGMVVTVDFGEGLVEKFLIGSREDATREGIEVYSSRSPLGLAITGKQAGEEVSYHLPSGKKTTVRVLDVERFSG